MVKKSNEFRRTRRELDKLSKEVLLEMTDQILATTEKSRSFLQGQMLLGKMSAEQVNEILARVGCPEYDAELGAFTWMSVSKEGFHKHLAVKKDSDISKTVM
jgi:hypothetical protein